MEFWCRLKHGDPVWPVHGCDECRVAEARVLGQRAGVPSDCAWVQKARARRLSRAHHDEPGVVIFASSRSVAIRFCNVRRLIPNIPAASLRLPRM